MKDLTAVVAVIFVWKGIQRNDVYRTATSDEETAKVFDSTSDWTGSYLCGTSCV